MQGKSEVSVRDDFGWDSKPGKEMLDVEECYSFSSNCCGTGNEDGHSQASLVYNCEYCIVSICLW